MIITSDGRLALSAAPSAILLWRHMGASAAAHLWNLAAMTDAQYGQNLHCQLLGSSCNLSGGKCRKDNFLSLIDQTLRLFLVQLNPLAIHLICVFVHSKKVTAFHARQDAYQSGTAPSRLAWISERPCSLVALKFLSFIVLNSSV